MPKVHLLAPEVISKIAAGEVIERPSSVVKELLENSLDAGSTSLELTLKNAGKSLIRLKDNGSGIEEKDIEHIFQRHSTSKLQSIDDLYNISSLGFRGEALYSIAAISDVTLRSISGEQETGWEIHRRGSQRLHFKPVQMQKGTEIEIRNLFFNTPARRKFLKSDTAELHRIIATVIPYTLIMPHCRFKIVHGNKTLIDLMPHQQTAERVARALKLKPEHLLYRQAEIAEENISLRLVLGDINIQRPRKDLQFVVVNDRPVQNRSLSFHINQAYRALMPAESNPAFYAAITVPPDTVDVNIHPAKREVKLRDEQHIGSLLGAFCRETLLSSSRPRQAQAKPYLIRPEKDSLCREKIDSSFSPSLNDSKPLRYTLDQERLPLDIPARDRTAADKPSLRDKLSAARFLGKFINKFLLFETSSSLLIIDQHAAQERITFESLRDQLQNNTLEIERFLNPVLITLSCRENLFWQASQEKLDQIGFSTSQWNEDIIAVHSAPALIKDPEKAMRNLLSSEEPLQQLDQEALARRACRSSLKTGYEMIPEQAEYLRTRLLSCQEPFSCPHGRPTVVELTEYTLDREFFRK